MVGHQKKSEDEDVQEVMDMFSNVGTLSRKVSKDLRECRNAKMIFFWLWSVIPSSCAHLKSGDTCAKLLRIEKSMGIEQLQNDAWNQLK